MIKNLNIVCVMLIGSALIGSLVAQPAFASGEPPLSRALQISGLYVVDFRLIDVSPDRVEFFKNQKTVYIRNKTDFNETLWLNMNMRLDKSWTAYARVTQNFAQHPNIFSADQSRYIKGGDNLVAYLDMYGLSYANGATHAKIGRQDLKLGPLGMLADTTLTVGDSNVYGVSISTKRGKMTYTGSYSSQVDNNTPRNYENKIWSVGASYAADQKVTVGAYYAAKTNADAALNWGSKTANYAEVNLNYKNIVPNVSFTCEVAWTKNDPFVSGLPARVLATFPSGTIKSYIYQLAYQLDRQNVLKAGIVSIPFLAGTGMSSLAPRAHFINFQHAINKQEMVEVYYKAGRYDFPSALYQIYGPGPYPERFLRITYWHKF
ncbi:MAG: hypothetical protein RIN56_06970 [Sporomusaceae bacterium]|nr:hypothetical protein [Sporomusaceae bacterium]